MGLYVTGGMTLVNDLPYDPNNRVGWPGTAMVVSGGLTLTTTGLYIYTGGLINAGKDKLVYNPLLYPLSYPPTHPPPSSLPYPLFNSPSPFPYPSPLPFSPHPSLPPPLFLVQAWPIPSRPTGCGSLEVSPSTQPTQH